MYTEELRKVAKQLGASLFGVCLREKVDHKFFGINEKIYKDLPYIISIGVRLSSRILEEIEDRPTRLYFFHYQRTNILLDTITIRLSNYIQEMGFSAIPIPASQIVDWENQRGHLSHKHVAQEAGLGWIGRNNLLVTEEYGAQVRLASIVTDIPLTPGKRKGFSCGNCRACVDACPCGAIGNSPEDFDHIKCFEYIRFICRKVNLGRQYICGPCVRACRGKPHGNL